MLLDLVNEVASANGLFATSVTATTQGASIDGNNYECSLAMIVNCQTITAANVTSMVVQAEESDTGTGSWTVISGMVVTLTATTAAGNLRQSTRGMRTKRYFRINANTVAVTTTTGAFGGTSVDVFGQAKYFPAGKSGADRSPSA